MYAFEYQRAKSLADAASALAKTGGKALAGGQSLVGAMKLRLANPGTLVDLSGVPELKGIKKDGDAIVIGALTTHAEVASSPIVKQAIPALAALAEGIGYRQVRNRGTRDRWPTTIRRRMPPCWPGRKRPHQQTQDRGRRFLQGHVRNGARRRRDHHRGQLSGAEESGLREVPAAGVALRAGGRIRGANGG
jgi:hypothetical protein